MIFRALLLKNPVDLIRRSNQLIAADSARRFGSAEHRRVNWLTLVRAMRRQMVASATAGAVRC